MSSVKIKLQLTAQTRGLSIYLQIPCPAWFSVSAASWWPGDEQAVWAAAWMNKNITGLRPFSSMPPCRPTQTKSVGLQIADQFHHLINRGQAGRVAGIKFMFLRHQQILHYHMEKKAWADVNDCSRHGGMFGALDETQVWAAKWRQHLPMSRERDLIQLSQELSQDTVQLREGLHTTQAVDLHNLEKEQKKKDQFSIL